MRRYPKPDEDPIYAKEPLYVKEPDKEITPEGVVLSYVLDDLRSFTDESNRKLTLNRESVMQKEDTSQPGCVYVEFRLNNVHNDTCLLREALKERWGNDGILFNNQGGVFTVNWGVEEVMAWGRERAGFKELSIRSAATPSMSFFWHLFYNRHIRRGLLLFLIAYLYYCFVVFRIRDDLAWKESKALIGMATSLVTLPFEMMTSPSAAGPAEVPGPL